MKTKISHAGVIREVSCEYRWKVEVGGPDSHFALFNAVTFQDGVNIIGLTIPLGAFIHLFILYEDGLIQFLCCKSEIIHSFQLLKNMEILVQNSGYLRMIYFFQKEKNSVF